MACGLLRITPLVAALLVVSSEFKSFVVNSTVIGPCGREPQTAARTSSPLACAPECGRSGTGMLSKTPLRGTALYSFMGSGNTWVRHLLTTASGILTGVIYPGEDEVWITGNVSRRVIAVKTHRGPQDSRTRFQVDRTVTILRNPYETFLAQFNFMGTYNNASYKHVGVRPIEDFRTVWPLQACRRCRAWESMYLEWLKDPAPIYVLVYHRLQENLERELHNVFDFLNETSIAPRIHCAIRDSEGHAHRQKPEWLEEAAVYPEYCRVKINQAIGVVQRAFEDRTGQRFQDFQEWRR